METVSPPPFALTLVEPMAKAHGGAVVVVVVAGDGVVELLEHAAANNAATSPILVTAAEAENVRWCLDIGRIF
jgi:hypothetical protein